MKIMALADVHQSADKWEKLVAAVEKHRPETVAIAGDLLPKDNGILAQTALIPQLREYAAAIKTAGAEMVLIPGNDDNQLVVPELEKGDRDGLWHCVAERVKVIHGFEFCGCPWILDYPFGYKYWVAPESSTETAISAFQIGPPLVINEQNEIETVPNLEKYLKSKQSIEESLQKLVEQVQNITRSIWLIHQPPANVGFDLCGSGAKVGSPQVYRFLSEKQPLLSIHGHVHESPACKGGSWAGKIGKTISVQPGQLDDALYYTTLEIEDGLIKNLRHSVYGWYS